jgi:hypothetical protein
MSATTEDDPGTMPEDELLALPAGEIPPGWLSMFFTRRADIIHQREMDELMLELSGNSARHFMIFPDQDPEQKRRRDEERERKEYARTIWDRQEHLLLDIEQRQIEIEKRRQEIEDNALHLSDGRRVYVDGNVYRNEQGRVLTGADAADAAEQHSGHPAASTWDQKQKSDRQATEYRNLKDKILKDREDGIAPEEAGNRLTGYEKEFTEQAGERSSQTPDYGSADYMADYGGPAGGEGKTTTVAFAAAAKGYENDPHETIVETTQEENAPQPLVQGAQRNA